eukprot:SAG11_NODE_33330_length_278_cov_0.564246_1_plen_45_part_10
MSKSSSSPDSESSDVSDIWVRQFFYLSIFEKRCRPLTLSMCRFVV